MQVKQRLKINAIVSIAAMLAILIVFLLSLYRINKANDSEKIAGDIIINAFERVTLRNDYLHNNNQRAKAQWLARHEAIGKILKSASKAFHAPEDKKNIDELLKNHESILKIFSAIVENREKNKSSSDDAVISQEVEDRLLSQLNIKVYEAVVHGRELLESSREARSSALRFAGVWITSILIILIAAMIINSRTMSRAIADRVRRLRDGALVIGKGDLDHRIGIKGDDEFSELSGAFNAMTAKLKTIYRELSTEVEERRRAEGALRQSEEQFRALANTIPNLAWWANEDGYITWYNRRWYEYTGTTPEQMEGWGWQSVHDPEALPKVLEQWKESISTGKPFDMEFPLRGVDGVFRTFLTRVMPLKDSAGRVVRWFGTNTDISALKRAEEALAKAYDELELRIQERTRELKDAEISLREMNESLEQRVAERTAELKAANTLLQDARHAALNLMEDAIAARKQAEVANTELLQEVTERKKAEADVLKLSEDMAERNIDLESVNKELEAFVYSVSHDLRAPLRHISSFAKFLTQDYTDRLDDQGRDYLMRIERGSEKMSRLIEDLMYLSQISRREISRSNVDMSKLASSIVADLREADPAKIVEFHIAEGITAYADQRLIEVALSNLLENAWKFTLHIDNASIEFGGKEQEGKTVYYVRDNGAGFNPEFIEKMFLPFQRMHSEKEFEGTGIGLAIVERVIRRHGGVVWAEGELGKGATMYFTLG
jgi:PAS domain S-box-containing protein